MAKNEVITAAAARELFSYDPETGVLMWRVSKGRCPAGREAGAICGDMTHRRRQVGVNGVPYKVHRVIWLMVHGEWPAEQIDHINGDALDNRLANLREATCLQNMRNRRLPSHNQARLKGVSKASKGGSFYSRISVGGKSIFLGCYKTPEEAHQAYVKAARRHFGEFARG